MAYTDLIRIDYPSEAAASSVVAITVHIKNQHSAGIYIAPTSLINDTIPVQFTPNYSAVGPGVIFPFTGIFIMPNADALIRADSWYWGSDNQWHQDDYQTCTVRLAGGVTPTSTYETLEVDITPVESGYVISSPASREGKTTWRNGETGTFLYGTNVRVTAVPVTGCTFEKWSDEIVGGVSYSNPAYVKPMTEHRAVKAHFTGIPSIPGPDFKLITDKRYPLASTYRGYSQKCSFSFSLGPEQIPGTPWLRDQLVYWFAQKAVDHGSAMLELRLWEDTSPTWTTDYICEVVIAISKPEASGLGGMGIEPAIEPITTIIVIIGAVAILIGLIILVGKVTELWYGPTDGDGDGGVPGIGKTLSSILPLIIMMIVMSMMSGIMGDETHTTRKPSEPPRLPRPPREKPYTTTAIRVAQGAVRAAEKTVGYISDRIEDIQKKKHTASEEERVSLEAREVEKQRKLDEAKEDLRKRREERDRMEHEIEYHI